MPVSADPASISSRSQFGRADVVNFAAACILAALVICGLYFGRTLLVPLALAVLLAFALAPVAAFLRRLGLPHAFAVALTVAMALLSTGALGAFIVAQVSELTAELPRYQSNLVQKVQAIRGSAVSNSLVRNASGLVHNVNAALASAPGKPPARPVTRAAATGLKTFAVAVPQPEASPFQVLEDAIDPFLEPLGTVAIVTILVIFILLRKEDLRDRLISLAGPHDLQRTATAIDDAANRLSRYLLLQSTVNISFGCVIGLGLWSIGLPNPALWGLIAALFRYVPYIGVPAAAAVPIALALAIDPGWQMALLTAALYFSIEPLLGQALEPWLYGRHMGVSPLAIVIAAGGWTLLWGPVGLLLSTPLTMCIVVMGRHISGLRFLEVLLGDQPALTDGESFYLRLLSGNPDEAADHAERFIKVCGLTAYLDDVALPALSLAQRDLDHSKLSPEKCEAIRATVEGLIANLSFRHPKDMARASETAPEDAARIAKRSEVVCAVARRPLDDAANLLLEYLLREQGIVTERERARKEQSEFNSDCHIRMVYLCLVDGAQTRSLRFNIRRLRSRYPSAQIMTGLLGVPEVDIQSGLTTLECDSLVLTFKEAAEQVARTLASDKNRAA